MYWQNVYVWIFNSIIIYIIKWTARIKRTHWTVVLRLGYLFFGRRHPLIHFEFLLRDLSLNRFLRNLIGILLRFLLLRYLWLAYDFGACTGLMLTGCLRHGEHDGRIVAARVELARWFRWGAELGQADGLDAIEFAGQREWTFVGRRRRFGWPRNGRTEFDHVWCNFVRQS